jgi:hypothetical protein
VKASSFRPRFSLGGLAERFSRFSVVKALGVVFLVGFLVRLVPELLAGALPIGWDTIHYAVVMKNGVVWPNWGSFFTSTWLLYGLTVPLYAVSGVDPFVLLKVVAPALYGLNVAGVYWFARKFLDWDVKMGLAAVGLFVFSFAALRISWDLLRNTLGMGLLLFCLPLVTRVGSRRGFLGFMVLSLLTVFAHEYAAVTWAFVFVGLLVWRGMKGRFGESLRVLLAGLPAFAVFAVGILMRLFPIRFESSVSNLISTGETSVGRFLFFTNYFAVNDSVQSYPNYWSLLFEVTLLFAFLYLPYMLLVWRGYFKNDVLNLWLGLLLVGAFGCLVLPIFALDYWSRWMFMLVYPFTFYATYGFFRIFQSSDKRRRLVDRVSRSLAKVGLAVLFLLGCGYLVIPLLVTSDNLGVIPTDVSEHFSSAPPPCYEDVNGVIETMQWLNGNMDGDSFVVLYYAFVPWGRLCLDQSHLMVQFMDDPEAAVDLGFDRGFSCSYFVWWNEPNSWYEGSVPEGFINVQNFDRLSIYVYEV